MQLNYSATLSEVEALSEARLAEAEALSEATLSATLESSATLSATLESSATLSETEALSEVLTEAAVLSEVAAEEESPLQATRPRARTQAATLTARIFFMVVLLLFFFMDGYLHLAHITALRLRTIRHFSRAYA